MEHPALGAAGEHRRRDGARPLRRSSRRRCRRRGPRRRSAASASYPVESAWRVEGGAQRRHAVDGDDDVRRTRRGRPLRAASSSSAPSRRTAGDGAARPRAVARRRRSAAGRRADRVARPRGRRGRRRASADGAVSRQAAATSDSSAVVVPRPATAEQRQVAVRGAPAQGGAAAARPARRRARRRRRARPARVGQRREPRAVRRGHVGEGGGVADRARRARRARCPAAARRAGSSTTPQPVVARWRDRPGAPRRLEHDGLARARVAASSDPAWPRGNVAGPSSPTTSRASAASCRRSARRRLVLARMSSLTTPAGRCVASTRWMPRLRPRWATPTSAGTNSGRSAARAANSSTTTTRRGSGARSGTARYAAEVVRAGGTQQSLTAADLGIEADERPLGEAIVEIGDEPDGVRQVGAGVERRPALVVDEDERQVVGTRAGGEARRRACAAARSCPSRSCRR